MNILGQERRLCKDGITRAWVKFKCPVCENEVWRDRRWVSEKSVCSKECRSKSRQKRIEVNCANCGKKIYKIKAHFDHSKTKIFFCDKKCKNEAHYNKKIFQRTKIIKCYKCGNDVEVDYRASRKLCAICNPKKERKSINWSEVLSGKIISNYHYSLRKYLLKNELKENKCEICGLTSWLGKKIIVHVHHVDGNTFNNLLKNLKMVCPNCHSQTDTWGSLNIKKKKSLEIIDEFLEDIASINEEAQYPTDLKEAIIGRVERFGLPSLILLDRDKCIDIFMTRDGMSLEDAEEFFEFNVIGSWVGDGTPCFATLIKKD